MSKTYRYLAPRKNSNVFAVVTDSKDQLSVGLSATSSPNGVRGHRFAFTLNKPFILPKPEGCEDACAPAKVVDLSVGISLSFPPEALATVKEQLWGLAAAVENGEFDNVFAGFPTNPTDSFTIGQY